MELVDRMRKGLLDTTQAAIFLSAPSMMVNIAWLVTI